MRGWLSLVGVSLMLLGACQAPDDAEPDEPGNYACFICTDFDADLEQIQLKAKLWAGEAQCSTNEVFVSPVADCFDSDAMQYTFDDCRRKPACAE